MTFGKKTASLLVIYLLYVQLCSDTPEDGLSIDRLHVKRLKNLTGFKMC